MTSIIDCIEAHVSAQDSFFVDTVKYESHKKTANVMHWFLSRYIKVDLMLLRREKRIHKKKEEDAVEWER